MLPPAAVKQETNMKQEVSKKSLRLADLLVSNELS
jgi:hypothetical protein